MSNNDNWENNVHVAHTHTDIYGSIYQKKQNTSHPIWCVHCETLNHINLKNNNDNKAPFKNIKPADTNTIEKHNIVLSKNISAVCV